MIFKLMMYNYMSKVRLLQIFRRTNIKFHAEPISNITPHQYQIRHTNMRIMSTRLKTAACNTRKRGLVLPRHSLDR